MILCSTVDDLLTALNSEKVARIGIDGIYGAGKTTLARRIATELKVDYIGLDSYLLPDQGAYLEFIDYRALSVDLKSVQTCVVEGICLRQVLARANEQIQTNVYIKRTRYGRWSDEWRLSGVNPVEEVLDEMREVIRPVTGSAAVNLGLDEEVIRYHTAFQPHLKAEINFLWDTRRDDE